jgi:hypothetical protein
MPDVFELSFCQWILTSYCSTKRLQQNSPQRRKEIPLSSPFTKGEKGEFGVREAFFADSVTHKQCKFQVCLAGLSWPKYYVSTLTKQSRDCKK